MNAKAFMFGFFCKFALLKQKQIEDETTTDHIVANGNMLD